MASPVTNYKSSSEKTSLLTGTREWRTRIEATCQNPQTKRWHISVYFQGRSKNGNTLSPVRVIYGVGKKVDLATYSKYNTYTNESFTAKNEWSDVGLYKSFDITAETDSLQTYSDGENTDYGGTYCVWVGSAETLVKNIPRTSCTYGGIDNTSPTVSTNQLSATNESITFQYSVVAPYDYSLSVEVNGIDKTEEIYFSEGTATIENLTWGVYSISLTANCENGQSTTCSNNFSTKPKYVTAIANADVYVDVGATVRVTPTITPQDASYPTPYIYKDESGLYNLVYSDSASSSPLARYVDITGTKQGTGYVQAKAADGNTGTIMPHTAVTTNIPVIVCNPAESLNLVEQNRKLLVGETYQIRYTINPKDKTGVSTDTTVTYNAINDINNQAISVSNTGEVTAIAEGVGTVNVSLAKRDGTYLTRQFVCIVVSQRPYNSDLRYPQKLTYSYIDSIYNNCAWIEDYLEIASPPSAPQTNGNLSLPSEVQGILNQVEAHIDEIYNAVKNRTDDEYGYLTSALSVYDTAQTWSGNVSNPRDNANRWKTFLDLVYSHLSPESAETISTETDENGDMIAVYFIDDEGDMSLAPVFEEE